MHYFCLLTPCMIFFRLNIAFSYLEAKRKIKRIMNSHDIIEPLKRDLNKDFALDITELKLTGSSLKSLEEIRAHLAGKIIEMLDNNPEKFLNTLYRMDVPEDKVKAIFHSNTPENMPDKLADLILERMLIKIKTRNLYREGKI